MLQALSEADTPSAIRTITTTTTTILAKTPAPITIIHHSVKMNLHSSDSMYEGGDIQRRYFL